ncbi:MAG: zinc ABC transporter substrate-binding protein [Planctomycetaceae bacterium]|jgi:zinc transport system substrate-binding protein|nr:zinc ABC transporter substrate-binding protein [Planctomycetaceae bacterium]
MNRNQKIFITVVVFLMIAGLAFLLRWNEQSLPRAGFGNGKLRVMVSIDPQRCFVERIGGDRVVVEVLVPAGKEPETYTPTSENIRSLTRCRVFFRVGFPAEESFLPRLKTFAPKLQRVDTRQAVPLEMLKPQKRHEHARVSFSDESHEADVRGEDTHDHDYDGLDPHIWVSPALVKLQAKMIRDVLISLDPSGETAYRENYETFIAEISSLQLEIHEMLDPLRGKTVYAYHPTYGYFCEEFGLTQKAIEIEGKPPTPKNLADWIHDAKDEQVRVILVQPEFNRSAAEKIAESTGATLVPHSTLDADYFRSLRELAKIIRRGYQL